MPLPSSLLSRLENRGRDTYRQAFAAGLAPPPLLTVSKWAERSRMLTSKSSSEPGRWRNERTPYLVEIMDALSTTSPVQEVVFMKGAQLGGTEIGLNWLGYIIEHAPGSTMLVMPSEKVQKRQSRQRIDDLMEGTPAIADRVSTKKSRDSGNTTLLKVFPGGMLAMATANSASDLRSIPVRNLILDEVDDYPHQVDDQGDPVELAERRTATYGARKKVFKVSTPTSAGGSRIGPAFELTDRRYYHVPCPECDHYQRIEWSRIVWKKREQAFSVEIARDLREGRIEVLFECEACKALIPEHAKTVMLERGQWIPEAPELSGKVRGYHLSALYSPLGMFSWQEAASSFVAAHAKNDAERLRVWVNTVLGELWKDKMDPPDWKRLYLRRESYQRGTVPEGGIFLTAGVDVQADRIHVEVVAWGRDLESWSVDYRIIPGKPELPEVWEGLEAIMRARFPHERGMVLPVQMFAVDSSAFTSLVYQWVRRQPRSRVMAVKGRETLRMTVGVPSPAEAEMTGKIRGRIRGVLLWPVGTDVAKEELYAWLKLEQPLAPEDDGYPAGWCHFPEYDEGFFQELTAEAVEVRTVRGYRRQAWVKTRPRNEALDCRVYARAAAAAIGINRWTEDEWDFLEAQTLAGAYSEIAGKDPREAPPRRPEQGADDFWKDR